MEFFDAPRQRNLAIPVWALVLLALAYALPGNFGHVPWRGDDALHIGIAFEMMQSGQWLTPAIAGVPWTEMPPLSHWLGAMTGTLFGWLLPAGDAIRMATVCGLLLALWLIRHTATKLFDETAGTAALLLSIGSIGLVVHAHEAQPMIWLLAMQMGNLYGLTKLRSAPTKGGLIAGIAAGGAFLSAGLPGLALTLPLWVLLPLGCRECRLPPVARGLLLGLLATTLLCALWPLALWIYAPQFLSAWWSREVADIVPHGGHLASLGSLAQTLGWFAWPLWPVALWAVWHQRKMLHEYRFALLIAAAVLAVALIITTGSLRAANVLPLLPALILLAASEVTRLRRGAANFFDWFGVMSFCLLGLFLWLAWNALHFGQPAPLARNIARQAVDFVPQWSWPLLVLAVGLSLGWIMAIVRMPFFPLRGALHWALGVTLLWGLAASLWLPWIDHTKNYQTWALEMAAIARKEAPADACIATLGAGDSQRAALYFFARLRVDPSVGALNRCPLLLTYAAGRSTEPAADENWRAIWEARRGRGRQADSFTLWLRNATP